MIRVIAGIVACLKVLAFAAPAASAVAGRLEFPLFGKEGPWEISAVIDGFTSSKKSPLIPLLVKGETFACAFTA